MLQLTSETSCQPQWRYIKSISLLPSCLYSLRCNISCVPVAAVPEPDFDVLFGIMQTAMQGMYERSHWGWHADDKRKEMHEPGTFFIVPRSDTDVPRLH